MVLFNKYPVLLTIISCVITALLTILAALIYFYIKRDKSNVAIVKVNTLCQELKEEDKNETKVLKNDGLVEMKRDSNLMEINSRYNKRLNQTNPIHTKYLHKSIKPFLGYEAKV